MKNNKIQFITCCKIFSLILSLMFCNHVLFGQSVESFQYDNISQLNSIIKSNVGSITYSYDEVGNRIGMVITTNQLPAQAGSISGLSIVNKGQSNVQYSVEPIVNATAYVWTLPTGASIVSGNNTNIITVNFSASAVTGDFSVYGTNSLGNGNPSPNFVVSVTSPAIVLISPNGGESWTVNAVKQISWNSSYISNVKIEYSTDGGTLWNTITSSTPSSASSYEWTVPNSVSSNCKIRINDVLNPSTNDLSDAVFAIVAEPTSTSTTIPMTISNWLSNSCGAIQETSEGIQLWGTAYRSGNSILSKDFYDLSNNAEIYMKWKVSGNSTYMYGGQGAYQTISPNFTTGWSYSASILISDNTWYYTHIKVNSDYSYSFVTSTNDYDDNGGTVYYSFSNTIAADRQYFIRNSQLIFQIADNYGSTGAWMVAAELKLKNATKIALTKVVSSSYDFENNAIPQGFSLSGDWDIANTGNNSNYSIHVNSSSVNKYFTINTGDFYGISYDIKSISGSSYKQPNLLIDDKYWFGGDNSSSGCWRNNTYTFPSKSTHTFKFEIPTSPYSSANVETWIDNIVFFTNGGGTVTILQDTGESTISIYPNPISNELTIETSLQSKPVNFEIVNLIGKVIYKGNVTGKTVVNTSGFSQGVYFVKVQNGKNFEFRKVIKK